jgi:probable rRNA maturation factor
LNKNPVRPAVFHHAYAALPVSKKLLFKTTAAIYSGEKIPARRIVHVIFCSDYLVKKLNAKFRNKPYPTDVLSFNYDEDDFFGELYISLQRAKVQARRYKVPFNHEVARLLVHGMLHLCGFDHERDEDRKRMEAREKRYYRHFVGRYVFSDLKNAQ